MIYDILHMTASLTFNVSQIFDAIYHDFLKG